MSSDLDDGTNAERYNTVCSNVLEAVASGSPTTDWENGGAGTSGGDGAVDGG